MQGENQAKIKPPNVLTVSLLETDAAVLRFEETAILLHS